MSAHGAAADPAFRVRSDHAAPLNADAGWAGEPNEPVTVAVDQPFRIRVELERDEMPLAATGITLQYRRNDDEDWIEVGAHDFPHPVAEEPRAPRLSVVSTPAYAHGEPALDLLSGSSRPFAGGAGINLAAQAPAWFAATGHLEFEWPLVIRRFADGPVMNETGDRFELRLVDGRGRVLPGQRIATVRATVPSGHLGGTFVETPGRIGPWQATNGDLYFIMEPTESDNVFMMVKSSDGGRTWREVDGAHRPDTRDLESVDARLVGDTIHIAHQVTHSVRYHTFRTADHPTAPDTWHVRDEVAASERSIAQAVSLLVRDDGSLEVFFVGPTLHHAVRSTDGRWQTSAPVDPAEPRILAGPQAVLDANGNAHLVAYRDDGTLWHRQFRRDGTLTAATPLADGISTTRAEYGTVLPLVYLPSSDTVVAVYRLGDGHLWERRIRRGEVTPAVRVSDRPVAHHVVDSQQPAADAVAHGETVHVLFVDEATRDLWSTHDRGGWQPATRRVADISGSWVRAGVHASADGRARVRFIYDAGSEGGGGMNRFGEYMISAP